MDWATLWQGANSLVAIGAAIGAASVSYKTSSKMKKLGRNSTVTTELKSVTVVDEHSPDGKDDAPRRVQTVTREGHQVIDLSVTASSSSEMQSAAATVVAKDKGGSDTVEADAKATADPTSSADIGSATMGGMLSPGPRMDQALPSFAFGAAAPYPPSNATTQALAVFVNGVTNVPGGSSNVIRISRDGGPARESTFLRPRAADYDVEAGLTRTEYESRTRNMYEAIDTIAKQAAELRAEVQQLKMAFYDPAARGYYHGEVRAMKPMPKPVPRPLQRTPSDGDMDSWMQHGADGMLPMMARAAVPSADADSHHSARSVRTVSVESAASRVPNPSTPTTDVANAKELAIVAASVTSRDGARPGARVDSSAEALEVSAVRPGARADSSASPRSLSDASVHSGAAKDAHTARPLIEVIDDKPVDDAASTDGKAAAGDADNLPRPSVVTMPAGSSDSDSLPDADTGAGAAATDGHTAPGDVVNTLADVTGVEMTVAGATTDSGSGE